MLRSTVALKTRSKIPPSNLALSTCAGRDREALLCLEAEATTMLKSCMPDVYQPITTSNLIYPGAKKYRKFRGLETVGSLVIVKPQSQHVTATTIREKRVMNGNCINAHFKLMQFGWHTSGLASSMQSWIRMWRFREMLKYIVWCSFKLSSLLLTSKFVIWLLVPDLKRWPSEIFVSSLCACGSCSLSIWDHLRHLETVFAWGNSMLEEGARGGAATVTFSAVRVFHHTMFMTL